MSRRNKGRIGGPFVPMLKDTMKTQAWKALSHGARSLYMALKCRYNSKLQNAVYLSIRVAHKELGSFSHIDNVGRWFRELQYYGFIVMESGPCLGVEGHGKAPHYRLTEEWYLGKSPTRDFLNWDGELFNEQKPPSYYKGKKYAAQKQNPVPPVRYTPYHPSGTVAVQENLNGRESVPPVRYIQQQETVPPVQYITSLTTSSADTAACSPLVPADNANADIKIHPVKVGGIEIGPNTWIDDWDGLPPSKEAIDAYIAAWEIRLPDWLSRTCVECRRI